jgi:hypothetical protein
MLPDPRHNFRTHLTNKYSHQYDKRERYNFPELRPCMLVVYRNILHKISVEKKEKRRKVQK